MTRVGAAPRRRADVVLQQVGGDAILLDSRTDEAHVINGAAARLWELCDGLRSVDEIATAFGAPFDMEAGEVRADVDAGLDALAALDLFERTG